MDGTASSQEVITDAVAGDAYGPQIDFTAAGVGIDANRGASIFGGAGGFSFGAIPMWVWLALGGLIALKVTKVI